MARPASTPKCPECGSEASYSGNLHPLWGWLYFCNDLDCRYTFWHGLMQLDEG